MLADNEYLCINDVFKAEQRRIFTSLPVKGSTYTLKEEVTSFVDGKKGLIFYELPNPHHPNGQEYSFRPSRFTKVLPVEQLQEELVNAETY